MNKKGVRKSLIRTLNRKNEVLLLKLGLPKGSLFSVSNVFYHCAEANNAPRLKYRVFIRIQTISEDM